MKCMLMLAGIADILPVAEVCLKEAQHLCRLLLENSRDDDKEELSTYQDINRESTCSRS